MANNGNQGTPPKLLPARAKIATALMNAQQTPFTPAQTAAVQKLQKMMKGMKAAKGGNMSQKSAKVNPTQTGNF